MRKLIEKFDSIHKMHHFCLIILVAQVLMWLLSGLAGSFRIPGSAGQLAMLVGMFLGSAVLPLLFGVVTLIFSKPSVAWGVVAAMALFSAYVVHRSEMRASERGQTDQVSSDDICRPWSTLITDTHGKGGVA